jgi:hypothetical protein
MEFYGEVLPNAMRSISYYYAGQTKRPVNLISYIKDPIQSIGEDGYDERQGLLGQYCNDPNLIFLYLERICERHPAMWPLTPGLGSWLAVLEVLMHEIGHHLQKENPFYEDNFASRGYWDCWSERDARQFAWQEIHRLAELDKNLFAPRNYADLGYLGIQASRSRNVLSIGSCKINPDDLECVTPISFVRGLAHHVHTFIDEYETFTKTKTFWKVDPSSLPEQEQFHPSDSEEEEFEMHDPAQQGWGEELPVFEDSEMDPCTDLPVLDDARMSPDEDFENEITDPCGIMETDLIPPWYIASTITYTENCFFKKKNPFAVVAEQEGIIWTDSRGRKWRYFGLGQAVRYGLLEHVFGANL